MISNLNYSQSKRRGAQQIYRTEFPCWYLHRGPPTTGLRLMHAQYAEKIWEIAKAVLASLPCLKLTFLLIHAASLINFCQYKEIAINWKSVIRVAVKKVYW